MLFIKFLNFIYISAQNLVATGMVDTEDILLRPITANTAIQDPALDPILPVSTGTTDGLLDSTCFLCIILTII